MNDFTKSPYQVGGKKKKRKIMKEFVMNEISAVDFGAQEGARAVLMKRQDDEDYEKLMLLTSANDGHSHGLRVSDYHFEEGGGSTDYAGESGDQHHDHPFVIEPYGTITIGENHGHTHSIDSPLLTRLVTQIVVQQPVAVVQMHSPLVKREAGKDFTAQDYALVVDPERPESWKYRLVGAPNGNPSRREVGNAVKALKMGQIPASEQATVIRRVRVAWTKCYSPSTPMPSVLKRVFS